jgi:hypothetical protein
MEESCFWTVHHLTFLKTRFGNWMFLPSGKIMVAPTQFGPLERASCKLCILDASHLTSILGLLDGYFGFCLMCLF